MDQESDRLSFRGGTDNLGRPFGFWDNLGPSINFGLLCS
jgi:hypothetical protein